MFRFVKNYEIHETKRLTFFLLAVTSTSRGAISTAELLSSFATKGKRHLQQWIILPMCAFIWKCCSLKLHFILWQPLRDLASFPSNIYLLKVNKITYIYLFWVNKRKNRKRCEICSKLIIKTPDQRHWHRSGVFIIRFEQISHLSLLFLLLTLNR